jgi:hypothetical protein
MAGTTDIDRFARGDDPPEPPEGVAPRHRLPSSLVAGAPQSSVQAAPLRRPFPEVSEDRRKQRAEERRARLTARKLGFTARHPAWPITALLVGYPIWWGLGLADFIWVLLIPPMVLQMVSWHLSGRRIRVPPGFGLWLLFLIIVVVGIATIGLTAPGTIASPVSHRVLAYANRTADYGGITVLLLYAGNLTESELSRRRLAWMLGLVGVYTVAGGLAGMVYPHLTFSSPLLHLLPKSVRGNPFIQASMEPGLSQVQNVLGSPGGRPKAPFDYTNIWGDCLTILLPYLFIGWWDNRDKRKQLIVLGVVLAAIAPLLYSLNRGAWIAVAFSVGYLAIRFALRGRRALLGGLCAVIAIVGLLVVATPLKSVITGRLHNGKSNNLRANLNSLAIKDGLTSPFIGYGDTRQEQGSPRSIAIGPSPKCPVCGQLEVGSTGQLWLLLVCDGFLGTALFLGFFCYGVWYYRRDRSPEALLGVLVILLSFIYMFTYDAVSAPLGFTMLAYALMWKGSIYRRSQYLQTPAVPAPASA